MKTLIAMVAVALVSGCAGLEPRENSRPEAVVKRLFVDRLKDQQSFDYFVFWGLPLVEGSFDTPLRTAFDNFKAKCERLFPPWGKWDKDNESEGNLPPLFVVNARNDPLTMCATSPAKTKVERLKEDASSAVYNVTYKLGIDGAIGQYYIAISTVSLVKNGDQWLVSHVSTSLFGEQKVKTFTFVSQLKFLSKQLELAAENR